MTFVFDSHAQAAHYLNYIGAIHNNKWIQLIKLNGTYNTARDIANKPNQYAPNDPIIINRNHLHAHYSSLEEFFSKTMPNGPQVYTITDNDDNWPQPLTLDYTHPIYNLYCEGNQWLDTDNITILGDREVPERLLDKVLNYAAQHDLNILTYIDPTKKFPQQLISAVQGTNLRILAVATQPLKNCTSNHTVDNPDPLLSIQLRDENSVISTTPATIKPEDITEDHYTTNEHLVAQLSSTVVCFNLDTNSHTYNIARRIATGFEYTNTDIFVQPADISPDLIPTPRDPEWGNNALLNDTRAKLLNVDALGRSLEYTPHWQA